MKHEFGVTVPSEPGAFEAAALGVNAAGKFVAADIGKPVKLAALNNYVLAADGDDLEAVVVALEPNTVNSGFSFGTVQRRFLGLEATVSAAGALTVGAAVICGPQIALGTANTLGCPIIKAGAGALFKWRVKSLLNGAGAAGTKVLIEPISR